MRRRAKALSQATGAAYVSRLDLGQPPKTLSQELTVFFVRPWALLFREPIVLLTSLYISVIYGTLYMFFAGFPIVFEVTRGWSPGIAGLPFIAVAVGVCLATLAAGVDNKRYVQLCMAAEAKQRPVEPEARLGTAMLGSIILPIGLFLFAFTTNPSVHWIAPILGGMLFSMGLVMVFLSLTSYVIDSCTFEICSLFFCSDLHAHLCTDVIYAASVLAAGSVVRAFFGAAFPLFTTQMYENLGNQWASSIPAFLALGCLPFPFLFYKYGPQIRSRCKYASEAARILEMMHQRHGVAVRCDDTNEPDKAAHEVV